MTPPQTPPESPYNRPVQGGMGFIVFNVLGMVVAASAGGSPLAGLISTIVLLGNVLIPVVALIKGWRRFAAGWAITLGVLLVALAGLCFYTMGIH